MCSDANKASSTISDGDHADLAHHGRWLNRNVFAFGLTSFLSDFRHEMATAINGQSRGPG